MSNIKIIVIDPLAQEVRETTIPNTLQAMYNAIGNGCTCITSAAKLPNGDSVYVDDDGLLHAQSNNIGGFFLRKLNINPIVSRGIIVGVDSEGETVDCNTSVKGFDAIDLDKYIKSVASRNRYKPDIVWIDKRSEELDKYIKSFG